MKISCVLLSAALAAGCSQTESDVIKSSAPISLPFETTCVVTGSDVTCSFALKELNEIVTKACGQAFVAGQGQRSRSTMGGSPRIFLGRTAEAEKALGADFFEGGSKYESETSCVFAKDGDLYLVGSDAAGTLWAVYDFVEDSLGYRWYQECHDSLRAENEIVPKAESVVFNGVATRRRPGFDGYRCDHENWGYFRLFRLRHRGNKEIAQFVPGYRFKLQNCTRGHGFDLYLPRQADTPWMRMKNYVPDEVKAIAPAFERHPEWFSMDEKGKRSDKMQLCLSSKSTRDALWQSLQAWVGKHGKGVYMIGSNDDHTGTYCYCKDCLALDKKYGGQCGALWDCIADLCGRLKAANADGVYITSLAYRHQTQLCPPGVTFPDNFICDFAPVTWDRSLSEVKDEKLPDGRVYDWLQNCRDWCKACPGGLSYWYYGNSICAYTWGRMSKELGEIHDAGVRSAGYCGLEGGFEFEDLMHHMWFWCLYHPHGDARAEFARAAATKYGPATDEILAYTDALEKMRQRVVATTPCGPTALDILSFASADELKAMGEIHDRAAAKAKGTKYAENVAWARISLDVAKYFKDGDAAAEARARTASKSYLEKVRVRKLMRKGNNPVTDRLDQMANYANLKSDALPPELAKYPREKVTRVLPAKSQTYTPWGRPVEGKLWSEPDPQAVCGFAMADVLDDDYIPGGIQELRIGLYDHNAGKYLIPFGNVKFPKGFWKKDEYRMFCLGRSRYASRTVLIWTDTHGYTGMPYSPLKTQLLSRLFDTVEIDKQFETWISVKAQGPKFFPGDTRPNKVFIEQIFSVEL